MERLFRIANFRGSEPAGFEGRLPQLALSMAEAGDVVARSWCDDMERQLGLAPLPVPEIDPDAIQTDPNLRAIGPDSIANLHQMTPSPSCDQLAITPMIGEDDITDPILRH